jgi:hypothetical protein
LACLAGCVALLVWVLSAGSSSGSADSVPLSAYLSPESDSLFSQPFMAGGLANGGQRAVAVEQAKHASPEAFLARLHSRTLFAHLDAAAAVRVVRQSFPGLIYQRDGGAPSLRQGERIRRYSSANVAQLSLPNHKRAVIESIGPMARRNASGHFEAIDLALKDAGSSFEPTSPEVAVQIPKHLRGGVRASLSGVSLTPTDVGGHPLLGSEGSLQGASVLYTNTQTDTDTLVKPTAAGFELSAILRSVRSPHELYYRLGLPSGARLIQHQSRSPVQIVSGGVTLGMVMPPSAVDAAGSRVPVTMSVIGDLLSLNVQDMASEYQYPLEIDPEYYTGEDRSLTGGVFPVEPYKGGTNWVPFHSGGFTEEHTYKKSYSCGTERYWCEQSWYIEPNREYNANEFAGLQYKTQGESTIYNLEMWVEGENEPSQTTTQVEYNYGPNGE